MSPFPGKLDCCGKEDNMSKISVSTKPKNTFSVKQLALVGLMSAIICVLAPFSIPVPISLAAPISLGTLAIYFVLTVLGMKLGTISVAVYILLGLVGLPVFSGFTGGPGKLFGPTGGYIIGYIFMALISGFFIDKWDNRLLISLMGMLLGTAALYLFGSIWLAYQASYTLPQALMIGSVPYIPGDFMKLALAMSLGRQLRRRLQRANLI